TGYVVIWLVEFRRVLFRSGGWARRRWSRGMAGPIGLADVSLGLHDPRDQRRRAQPPHDQPAEQIGCHLERRPLEPGQREGTPGRSEERSGGQAYESRRERG